ncbi:MAG TPA: OsmC family protein [Propionibacteriaceae bacterium]|nr:OsmC family protein [Propionibacteriaceae bacterium]HPZ50979.1 OsmC family protein [Propionibacteriaceae bacterium]
MTTSYTGPGLAEHLVHKGRAMRQAGLDRPHVDDWHEDLEAVCVADDVTGVRKLRIRDWGFIGDGGPAIGGNDLGPTSPELLLGVISTCFTHTITIMAALEGVPLDRVEVRVTAANNDANFFGVESDRGWVPYGIAATVTAESMAAEPGVVDELVTRAGNTCPVLQMLRRGTPIEVRLAEAAA